MKVLMDGDRDSWDDSDDDLIEAAWGLIANVHWGGQGGEWNKAAIRWRDRYHKRLSAMTANSSDKIEEPIV